MALSKSDNPVQGVRSGFTLAELLVTLLILAEIFVFTIPKVLVTQQNQQYKARAKDVAGMITGAYQQLQLNGRASANTKGADLTPYMNFLSIDTTSSIDDVSGGLVSCDSVQPCLRLHGGGLLRIGVFGCGGAVAFGGTSTTHYIGFQFDPDGLPLATGVKDAVEFDLFYNGRLSSRGAILGGQNDCFTTGLSNPALDPTWFSW